MALPAIVWIGATLPLAVAAKPRIAFEPGLETNISPLALLTASPKLSRRPRHSIGGNEVSAIARRRNARPAFYLRAQMPEPGARRWSQWGGPAKCDISPVIPALGLAGEIGAIVPHAVGKERTVARARAREKGVGVSSDESFYGCFGWFPGLAPRVPRLGFIPIAHSGDDAGQVFLGNGI